MDIAQDKESLTLTLTPKQRCLPLELANKHQVHHHVALDLNHLIQRPSRLIDYIRSTSNLTHAPQHLHSLLILHYLLGHPRAQ
jgi:hypothetical protein